MFCQHPRYRKLKAESPCPTDYPLKLLLLLGTKPEFVSSWILPSMPVLIPTASLSPTMDCWQDLVLAGLLVHIHSLLSIIPPYYFLPCSRPCSRVPGTVGFCRVSRYLILPSLTHPSALLSKEANLLPPPIQKPFRSPNIKA